MGLEPFGLLFGVALYVGCAWGWTYSLTPGVKSIDFRPSAMQRMLISLTALLLLYALARGLWPELNELDVLNALDSETTVLAPRIFSDGSF